MSTAISTQHHRFPHPIAMAAAATVVVLGGATAIGVAVSRDGSTAPTAPQPVPTHVTQPCNVSNCIPGWAQHHGKDRPAQPPKGGHTVNSPL